MPTEQRRYQVFVSSTYRDLYEARQHVTMTLLECDAFPTGMEIFPAADDDAWTLIKRVIDESDYYLLVIAGKYGSIDEDTGLSYTEMEYNYAVTAGKPVMAFLYEDLGKLESSLCENTDDLRRKLADFRNKVCKAKHVKFWSSPEELAGQVSLTYNKFVRFYDAIGWVRADEVVSAESLKELLEARSRIEELEAELSAARHSAPVGAENLSQGSEEFHTKLWVTAQYEASDEPWGTPVSAFVSINPTWDSLFGMIAPQLLQDATENDLRKILGQDLIVEFYDEAVSTLLKLPEPKRDKAKKDRLSEYKAELHREDFGTIIIQLRALGLIKPSERKRSIRDVDNYWALTAYGEARTIQLRAIKTRRKLVDGADSGASGGGAPAPG